jgi:hypothetical protein
MIARELGGGERVAWHHQVWWCASLDSDKWTLTLVFDRGVGVGSVVQAVGLVLRKNGVI